MRSSLLVSIFLACAAAISQAAPQDATAADRAEGRRAVRAVPELAIERGVPLFNDGKPGACADVYEVSARAVLDLGSAALSDGEREALVKALGQIVHNETPQARAWRLRHALDDALRSLDAMPSRKAERVMKTKPKFEVLMESPLPQDFPKPGPVGAVVVKEYPQYRAARAQGGQSSFWTLFQHIKQNEIEMTAPVEMTMSEGEGDGALSTTDMAFLYGDPDLGKAGRDGQVDVVDLAPARVLSIGVRGPLTPGKIQAAKREVETQAARHGWKRSGSWRLMGYNSPMVPATKRFWELQLPVRREQDVSADIVDAAVAAGQFKTLVAALKAADLVKVLKGDGPFTVFAPTDDAFAKLPQGTVAALLKPENSVKLTRILTYHVVSGRVPASAARKLSSAKTVAGLSLEIAECSGTLKIDDAKVTKADIQTSNGVIHVIDTVLIPE
jgi:uncharacterized surface protein with fasciclin (FAS1) repeats